MLDKDYGSSWSKHKFSFELFAEPFELKSLLITQKGKWIKVPEFQFNFIKKSYINISFDNIDMVVYISKYIKGMNIKMRQEMNESSLQSVKEKPREFY